MNLLISKQAASSGWMNCLLAALFIIIVVSTAGAQNKSAKITTVVVSKPGAQNKNAQGSGNEIFTSVEHSGEFPGGIEKFRTYLSKNLRYPAAARQKAVQGKVFLTFVIEKNGSLSDIKVARGIGSGCDEEAVRVIKSSPKWKPATQNGRVVSQQYTMPLLFTLADTGRKR